MTMGSNHANQELQRRARALCDILDQIAELQVEAKDLKAEAKEDGYDMKAFGQIVKELRKGAKYQADQLQLELVLDTYRSAVDLPTDLEVAQQRARDEAATAPEPASKRGRSLEDALSDPALDGTAMSVDGGTTYHELGSKRRRAKAEVN